MYELVEVRQDEVFTNSKIIAEGTNNQHESIVAFLDTYNILQWQD